MMNNINISLGKKTNILKLFEKIIVLLEFKLTDVQI